MKLSPYLFVILFFSFGAGAQNPQQLDSMIQALPKMQEDSNKLAVLNTITKALADVEPVKGVKYGKQAVALAEKLKLKPGMAAAYNGIGVNYKNLSDHPKALDFLFRSLEINEQMGNEVNAARNMGNIGTIYRETRSFNKALEYSEKALSLNRKLRRDIGVINNLSDMGTIYAELKKYDTAHLLYKEALQVCSTINDIEGMAIVYGNVANTYSMQQEPAKAIEYFLKALKINRELNRSIGVATNLLNLAALHYQLAVNAGANSARDKKINLDKAIAYGEEAARICADMSFAEGIISVNKNLAEAYSLSGNYKAALDAHLVYTRMEDSVSSTDNKVKLANLNAERAESEKMQQEKLTALAQSKRRNEAIAFTCGLLLLGIFTVFVVRERRKSDKLLLNILPEEVATELKIKGNTTAKYFDNVTVLFTDFVNFTTASEKMTPQELVNELHTCFKTFDDIMARHKIEKIKTVGDAYLAVSGLPAADANHAHNVVAAALEIRRFIDRRSAELGDKGFLVRIGINSGSVVAGIVGIKKFAYDIWGDTVNTAARMEQSSEPGKINISQTTYDMVKDEFRCTYRGEFDAKNKGRMAMYFVEDAI